ncbi:hypothetical protein BDV29DRAFT_138836 [Aspergillus leporis]|jgi:hypothetical protein|uniref:Uncharacterized protein n=1 Tax=Aspergillus leporis TaxID=41062 RepID=A0A5N5X1W8_9EURO|nr:hypothetical protein BDV29DRAFT_138836 [Aspergillus leporis]
MTRVLSETSQLQQQLRPKTDYERWFEEQDQSYSVAENPQYHPPIPAVEDQNLVFHRVLNDSPRKKIHDTHSTHPGAVPRPVDRSHGEFLARSNTRPHASLKGAITEALQDHYPYQLALLLVLFIAFLCGVKTFTKRRRRAIALPISELAKSISPVIDEKHLV